MRRLLLPIAAALIVAVVVPARAAADSPGRGQILALGDHVLPGQTMTISGAQLDAGASISFRLSAGTTELDLGTTRVAADGTLELQALIPVGTPVGYSEITATNGSGSTWTTYVLIGERAEGAGSSAAPAPIPADGPIDDGVIGLLMAAFGGVLIVVAGLWWWTGRRRKDAPAG